MRSSPKRAALIAAFALACTDDETTPAATNTLDLKGAKILSESLDAAYLSIWSDRSGGESVWVVGGAGGRGRALEWKGDAWTDHETGIDQRLWWVHGFQGGPVIVVGEGGVAGRFEGSQWTPTPTDAVGSILYGVWGATPDDLWAVGGPWSRAPTGVTPEGDIVLRWKDDAWSRFPIPVLDGKPASAQKFLFKVWGTSADQAIIVGSSGLALHWDGASWRQEPTGDTASPLFTVSGRAADDAYAIGGFNDMRVIHWDGATWSPLPPAAFSPALTQGIFAGEPGAVYVGGISGYFAQLVGSSWTEPEPLTAAGFHAVWIDGDGEFWAAGGDIMSDDPSTGVLVTTRTGVVSP